MRFRYQRGYLRCVPRKYGPACWEFLWRETTHEGKRVRRTAVIGTVEQLPTRELAMGAANGLRMYANQIRSREPEQHISVGDLIDHYIQTELSDQDSWHSLATKLVYREFLTRWIRPHWAQVDIRGVRTVAVDQWMRDLQRGDGKPLADATKAKIRNLMSVLFNHAIRYEWLEQGKNPITFVRQSAKRKRTPEVLETHEIQNLLRQLRSCFRLTVLLDVTTGLRRSELFALRWSDVDFRNLVVNVGRSIYLGKIGNCKTETSRRPLPLDIRVAAELWLWKESCRYAKPNDWIFASPRSPGTIAVLARCSTEKDHSPSSIGSGYYKDYRMAYVSTFLLDAAHCERRKCESGPGVDETCHQPLHA
ncbi:MAG: tyrosine-type recombinase/integrase [Acidobacteria bacterium]|nr:tyrosine-type recombinase/integrase [Acidobacteriota bacterium]